MIILRCNAYKKITEPPEKIDKLFFKSKVDQEQSELIEALQEELNETIWP